MPLPISAVPWSDLEDEPGEMFPEGWVTVAEWSLGLLNLQSPHTATAEQKVQALKDYIQHLTDTLPDEAFLPYRAPPPPPPTSQARQQRSSPASQADSCLDWKAAKAQRQTPAGEMPEGSVPVAFVEHFVTH